MPFEPFQADEHKQENDLLPVDKYNLAVTKTEMKPTKSGGEMLNLQMTVQDGKFQGRVVFTSLNMVAPPGATENQIKATKIAKATLGDICRACGKAAIASPDDLLAIPFVGEVTVEAGNNGYADRNKVKKYLPRTASTPVSAAAPW